MPVEIVLTNQKASIVNPKPLPNDLLPYVVNALRYHPAGYDQTWKFKNGKWDGYEYLFDVEENSCRAGLVGALHDALRAVGCTVNIRDEIVRASKSCHFNLVTDKTPRPYQEKCREIVRKHSRGIISSPTGTGKTFMMSIIINELKKKTIVILNDLILLGQTKRELEKFFGDEVGVIGDSVFNPKPLTVATIQSLRNILSSQIPRKPTGKGSKNKPPEVKLSPKFDALIEYLRDVSLILHDEVHLADCDGVNYVYQYFPMQEYVYGMSATPYSWEDEQPMDKNLNLQQNFGTLIYDTVADGNDFIKLGVKSPVMVNIVHVPKMHPEIEVIKRKEFIRGRVVHNVDHRAMYRAVLEGQVLFNPKFHQMVADNVKTLMAEGKTNYVFAPHSLEYLESIAVLIPGCKVVHGKISLEDRLDIFRELHEKKILCVVSDIGSVGLDIPSLDVLHNVSDFTDIRQIEGRVARKHPDKVYGVLVDYVHDTPMLRRHFDVRMSQYRELKNMVIGDAVVPMKVRKAAKKAFFDE